MRKLVWFRNDLRVSDNPALAAAAARGEVVGVYCVSIEQWRSHDMGDRRLAFQLRCLHQLAAKLAALGIPMKVLDTPSFDDCPNALLQLCQAVQADELHFVDEYPLNERKRDTAVSATLSAAGVAVSRHVGDVIVPPHSFTTGSGGVHTVFSPYFRKWLSIAERNAESLERAPAAQTSSVASDPLPESWDGVSLQLAQADWQAGEDEAQRRLQTFVETSLGNYGSQRDLPAINGTSSLSSWLAVGCISARQCLSAALYAIAAQPELQEGAQKWIGELAWRDFYRQIVAEFDHVSYGHSFKRALDVLPWRDAPEELQAWQQGLTGYPFVDAAMRQLNQTGWMHNRLRMVSAMFLTKHLLIDWRAGERYFMQQLVDGDFASNNGGWQWSASTGTDAAPYFRIFNPESQGKKFDKHGEFVRKMVPELATIAPKNLFAPAQEAGVSYPAPIVDHKQARARALEAFKNL